MLAAISSVSAMTSPTSLMVGRSGDLGSVARAFGLLASRAIPTRLRSEGVSRRKTFRALQLAANQGLFVGSSRTDGLRAVRLFEAINGVWVDPANSSHRLTITNTGWYFALQRRLKASQNSPDTREGSKAEGHGRPNQDSPIPTQGQQP